MKKTSVLESIADLPEDVSIDEIIQRLLVIEKIEKGKQQVKEGKVNTEDQARAKLNKWLS